MRHSRNVTRTALRHSRPPVQLLSVTVSIGLAERDTDNVNAAMVIQAADRALYQAKQVGRNRVATHGTPSNSP